MTKPYKILGDWGNTSGRLYLCDISSHSPSVIDSQRVTGAKDTSDHEVIFLDAIAPWRTKYTVDSALICGAIGANIGWKEVGYTSLPADHSQLMDKAITFEVDGIRVCLLGGVSIEKSIIGLPDTLRGEETQAIGWMTITGLKDGLLCMPGTHTKWASLSEGKITQLNTGLSGELFELMSKHSVLTRGAELFDRPNEAYNDGVNVTKGENPPTLIQTLMSVRNRQLLKQMNPRMANSYMAGLMIGEDVRESLARFKAKTIHIIGGSITSTHYQRALELYGVKAISHDDQACTIAGLNVIMNSKAQL